MRTVSIIGIGRVGGALALALPEAGYSIDTLIYRDERHRDVIQALNSGGSVASLETIETISSDIVFITTQDAGIAAAAAALAPKLRGGNYVFHTSGALSSEILAPVAVAGCNVGSIHPLVSISASELGPERFKGSYFCVEGQPDALKEGRQIVMSLGGRPFTVDTEFKTLYHAAAVTACGHLVALFDAAVEMMTKCGLSADESRSILLPLVRSTVENLAEQTTAQALTGTFSRADVETFVNHIKTLNKNASDDLLEIYLLLGERSLDLAAKQGVSTDRVETMRARVAIAKSKLKW
jgi:predicted short-subunit dehydrogenase-like oxidoreductase (DUF2520 family)